MHRWHNHQKSFRLFQIKCIFLTLLLFSRKIESGFTFSLMQITANIWTTRRVQSLKLTATRPSLGTHRIHNHRPTASLKIDLWSSLINLAGQWIENYRVLTSLSVFEIFFNLKCRIWKMKNVFYEVLSPTTRWGHRFLAKLQSLSAGEKILLTVYMSIAVYCKEWTCDFWSCKTVSYHKPTHDVVLLHDCLWIIKAALPLCSLLFWNLSLWSSQDALESGTANYTSRAVWYNP